MDQLSATLLSAPVLFFVLGALAAAARSDLAVPETIAKGMSLYLMAAIGLKGGVEVATAGIGSDLLKAMGVGVLLSALIPFVVAPVLTGFGKLDRTNAGAVAAHYGSVSVVTFVTASQVYGNDGFAIAGFMVAVLAMMETPAILSGLFIARRQGGMEFSPGLLREVFFNGSVVLLIGSFIIGILIGKDGYEPISPLFKAGFTGVLCLFLLDMGLIAMRRILQTRALTLRLAALAIAFPIVNGTVGVMLGTAIGLDMASAAALGVLAASASYIAVPAAMRLSLPQADAGLYLAMSLGVTFPFNIVLGIPLFRWMAETFGALS
ncbi:sodium-dependent bicarbonate transport family permease [Parerythrobacter aurantius]|uniref:sodium-dependent bicarbonate transport family permease n=1 Tax=Parerythrobacter aurantius TaxID=3127706 RepID=UPI00325406D2